jgi:predicted permease
LAIAWATLATVPRWLPDTIPLLTRPGLDPSVAAFAVAVALLSAAIISIWPVQRLVKSSPAPRGVPEGTRGHVYRVLVISQISVAVALVSAAGLLSRSLHAVRSQSTGFTIDNVLVAQIGVPSRAPSDPRRVAAAERDLLSAVGAVPGVRAAAVAYDHPLEANWSETPAISGDTTNPETREQAELRIVSPSYFEAIGIELLDGRTLNARDDLDAPGAAVINEALARQLGGHTIGRRLQTATPRFLYGNAVPGDFIIVGVVENERSHGLETPAQPAFYLSTRQFPQTGFSLLVRTSEDPLRRAADVRAAVAAFDRSITFDQPTTLRQLLAGQLAARRVTTSVIESFAGAALVLAALGLYGLLGILVASRTREIGVRLALGARPAVVARGVLRESLLNTAAGVTLGCFLALAAGRFIQSLLVGVSASDPTTLGIVIAALMAVSAAAALAPARRASRIDPIQALRAD